MRDGGTRRSPYNKNSVVCKMEGWLVNKVATGRAGGFSLESVAGVQQAGEGFVGFFVGEQAGIALVDHQRF